LDLLQVLPLEILHYAYDRSNGRRRIVVEAESFAQGFFIAEDAPGKRFTHKGDLGRAQIVLFGHRSSVD
jgi:kynureninase